MEFEQTLQNLYRLHYASMNFNHMVEYQEGNWTLFEPSRFVYCYFTFNSIYSIDWNQTIGHKNIRFFESSPEPSDLTKAKTLIDFIYEKLPQEDINYLFNEYVISKYNDQNNFMNLVNSVNESYNISSSEQKSFKEDLINAYHNKYILKGKLKNSVMRFIIMVRNNVFHGSKDLLKMTEKRQRERLELYAKILNFINICVFEIIDSHTGIFFEKKLRFRL